MIIYIHPYHGPLPSQMCEDLNKFATPNANGWVFNGTLDEFVVNFGRKFMAIPDRSNDTIRVYVTQFGSFSQR